MQTSYDPADFSPHLTLFRHEMDRVSQNHCQHSTYLTNFSRNKK